MKMLVTNDRYILISDDNRILSYGTSYEILLSSFFDFEGEQIYNSFMFVHTTLQ